jgi:hypothetical protein
MPFVPFYQFDPDRAHRETRSVILADPDPVLPAGQYSMIEMYCDEPGCDCRRVLFMVFSRDFEKPLAIVNYGWESVDFYARRAPFLSRKMAEDLHGPSLNPGSPQSKMAPAILSLIREVVLQDPAYIERLKRHYAMVREAVDGKPAPQPFERPDPRQRKRLRAEKLRELQARRSLKKKPRP